MSFVCPECGATLKHKRTLQTHRYTLHGVRGGDPRLDEATMDELERVSDLNLLRFLGPKLDKIRANHRKALLRLGIVEKKYFRSNGSMKFTYTAKGLELRQILEAET